MRGQGSALEKKVTATGTTTHLLAQQTVHGALARSFPTFQQQRGDAEDDKKLIHQVRR